MSPKIKVDTVIVSDVHLGSRVSRSNKLIEILSEINFNKLILLGDLFDGLRFNRLNKKNWDFLTCLRNLSSAKNGREIIWIRGNHDEKIADMMAHFIGAKVCDEYIWEHGGRKFLAIHGDKFDKVFIRKTPIVGKVARFVFLTLQYVDPKSLHIVRFLEHSHSSWLRLSSKVANGAVSYARDLEANHVFCGHTHKSMQEIFPNENKGKVSPIHYYNVGCWTKSPSTFAVIDDTGEVFIETVK